MLTGDNSILKRAAQLKEDDIIAQENEQIKLAVNSSRIDELGEKANAKGVRKYFKSQGEKVYVYQNDDEIEIEYLDTGHKYIVKANGEIVKQEGTDAEEKNVYYKIDGTTLYLSSIKKDESYKETEDYYYNSKDDAKLPEWVGEITTNEEGKKVLPLSSIEKVVIENRIQPKNTSCWFLQCVNLSKIENIGRIDTRDATNMRFMFNNCTSLSSLDVSNFNTSNVTDMNYMFSNCNSLSSLDVSNFDTSKVINMSGMFYSCTGLTSLDTSNFDTRNVTDMVGMFYNCKSLSSLDVSNFNTSNVTNMGVMFYNCNSLSSLDVSNFDTSKVINMSGMFYNCTGLTSLDTSNFDTRNVKDMQVMFAYCTSLTLLDVSNFNTGNVTNMYSMFNNCSSLASLDVSDFDTSKVTNMGNMFHNCTSLTTLDVSGFNTSNVTNMSYMFNVSGNVLTTHKYSLIENLDFSNWDTSKVENMTYFLESMENLTATITIKGNVKSYEAMLASAATRKGKITLNYTAETESIVDEMIKTKSKEGNVVKGNLVT